VVTLSEATLRVEDLLDRRWRFKRGDGPVLVPNIRFNADGSVLNNAHDNEKSWSLQDGFVSFHNSDGDVTTSFTSVTQTPLGLVLSGEFKPSQNSPTPVVHVLEDMSLRDVLATDLRRDLLGQVIDSFDVDALAFFAAGVSSSQYVARKMLNVPRFSNGLLLLSFACSKISRQGLFLEFGVFSGRSLNHLAGRMPEQKWFGFDSFEGLPEDWRPGFPKGAFARAIPEMQPNVELIVGWFDQTLPAFLREHNEDAVAFLHVDCDLYSSTRTIFGELSRKIGPGTIIVFDEYYNYPGWEIGEFQAFQEFIETAKLDYEYIGLVPSHQQVAVRII
jgi:hypothetical protein